MAATETRIPASKKTRDRLRIEKAKRGHTSYDELLQELLDAAE